MVQCAKCDFTYDPALVPGGLCPRCLLLGIHGDEIGGVHEDDESAGSPEALADEELASELPNFELEEHLGRGGMGVVWKARERVLNRHVAIKLLRNAKNDTDFVDRFTREARVMAQLNHPHIVTLYSFGRTRSNHCYLVMEMVDGASLADLLQGELLDVPVTLDIIQQVCTALRHAHDAGFMHRDIKPGNVLISARGRVKVADFGLARLANGADSSTTITGKGFAVGTPHYIAPEQANGNGHEDHRADIYSVGVVLYQMLTGEVPRGVFRPPSAKRKLDRRLDNVVLKALQEEPEKRYQHISELGDDVQKVRENVDPVLLADQQAVRHAHRWRQRFEIGLATAVSLVLGFIIAWYAREWLGVPALVPGLPNSLRPEGGVSVQETASLPRGDGLVMAREIRIQPPSLASGSLFGSCLSVSGDWLAIGAPNDVPENHVERGCVYLYRREADGTWKLRQCLSNPHAGGYCRFGYDVALDGMRLVVSSPSNANAKPALGNIDMYELAEGSDLWRPSSHGASPLMHTAAPGAKLHLSGNQLVEYDVWNESGDETSPRSFAFFTPSAGDGTWRPEYTGPSKGFPFLAGCALAGTNGLVACLAEPADAKLFGQSAAPLMEASTTGEDWKSHLHAIAQPQGQVAAPSSYRTIAATAEYAIAGNAKWNHLKGIAWVLRRNADGHFVHDTWLTPPANLGSTEFGKSVAVYGSWAAIGADHHVVEDGHRGAVYLYHRMGDTWIPACMIPADAKANAKGFGYTLALTPGFMIVGAPRTGASEAAAAPDDETGFGAVFIYEFARALP
jgi:tRNA A-37 threonylcarbamoyl transferase component Bud32